MLDLKRVYDPPSAEEGYRVLVDRLSPRGLMRDGSRIDAWLKDVAPSDELRHWFGHDPVRWPSFRRATAKNSQSIARFFCGSCSSGRAPARTAWQEKIS